MASSPARLQVDKSQRGDKNVRKLIQRQRQNNKMASKPASVGFVGEASAELEGYEVTEDSLFKNAFGTVADDRKATTLSPPPSTALPPAAAAMPYQLHSPSGRRRYFGVSKEAYFREPIDGSLRRLNESTNKSSATSPVQTLHENVDAFTPQKANGNGESSSSRRGSLSRASSRALEAYVERVHSDGRTDSEISDSVVDIEEQGDSKLPANDDGTYHRYVSTRSRWIQVSVCICLCGLLIAVGVIVGLNKKDNTKATEFPTTENSGTSNDTNDLTDSPSKSPVLQTEQGCGDECEVSSLQCGELATPGTNEDGEEVCECISPELEWTWYGGCRCRGLWTEWIDSDVDGEDGSCQCLLAHADHLLMDNDGNCDCEAGYTAIATRSAPPKLMQCSKCMMGEPCYAANGDKGQEALETDTHETNENEICDRKWTKWTVDDNGVAMCSCESPQLVLLPSGHCECPSGFATMEENSRFLGCLCQEEACGANASCQLNPAGLHETCVCLDGFEGDPFSACSDT